MLLPGDEEQLEAFHQEYQKTPPSSRGPFTIVLVFFAKLAALAFGMAFVLLCVGGFFYFKVNIYDLSDEQGLAQIVDWEPQDNSQVFDKEGALIGEFFSEDHIFVSYSELPKDFINALVAIEDRQFWQHQGVDLRGILRAMWVNLNARASSQGGSTITQQLVRHFLLDKEKTISRKLREIVLAFRLETMVTKRKIIEIYANTLFLGNGAYGVASAAKRYFNRPLAALKTHELALIAGLFQSPSRYNPEQHPERAQARQQQVLQAMGDASYLTPDQVRIWQKQKLVYSRYRPLNQQKAPYFIDYVYENTKALLKIDSAKNAGLRIYTSLDSRLQKAGEESLVSGFKAPMEIKQSTIDGLEGALLSINPQTGEILAMTGGRDYKTSQFNRCTQAKRQPGSLFKPIVYSYALMHGYRWSDVVYVSPLTIDGKYRPRSVTNDYMKETTLLRAFFRSMNSPTLELGQKMGINPLISYARQLGISSPIRNEFGSLLGSSELTMMELAKVYGTFANMGMKNEISAIRKIEDRDGRVLYERDNIAARRVIPAQIAYLTVEGMRQVLLRGTASNYPHLGKWAAGKTGTTNDSTDNWFAGFSPKILALVWVGPDQATAQPGWLQGSTVALPIWARFMEKADKIYPQPDFGKPTAVVSAMVDPVYGKISKTDGIQMWFLQDNQPQEKGGVLKITPRQNYRDPFF